MRRILLAAVLVAVVAPAPERRGSPGILPTDRGLAWLVDGQRFELADHDRSFPRSGRGGVGQLRARLAGRSGGVGAARAGGDTGSGAAGRRRRPARPRTARQGVVTMTADSRQLGADAHREGVRVQQEHGEALRGGFDEPVLMRCRGE